MGKQITGKNAGAEVGKQSLRLRCSSALCGEPRGGEGWREGSLRQPGSSEGLAHLMGHSRVKESAALGRQGWLQSPCQV